jgi:hypothetical protein
VSASVRGVIDTQNNLAGQQPLNPDVPLIKLGITGRRRAQVVRVLVTPVRKLSVLRALRTGEAAGNGFSSVADWVAKLSFVKNRFAVLRNAEPGYWKFVAGLIPK